MKNLFFIFTVILFSFNGFAQSCLPEGINFTTQAQIDSFQVNYPGCTEIEGDVNIQSLDINNLNGLSVITIIGGDLNISYGYLLNLEGLENLTYIGGDLRIYENSLLNDISGLNNLTLINGALSISYNYSLTNLSGLDNITAGSITDLQIINNYALSTCEVQSICDYLAGPNGVINIHANNGGCNSQEEVEAACGVGIGESVGGQRSAVSIYPNPTSTAITISTPITPAMNTFMTIYTINGQQLMTRQITKPLTVIDIGSLQTGIYFMKFTDDSTVRVMKIVKE